MCKLAVSDLIVSAAAGYGVGRELVQAGWLVAVGVCLLVAVADYRSRVRRAAQPSR